MNLRRRYIGKDKDKAPSQMGLFAHPDDKVLKIFNRLKQKAEQIETMPRSESGQVEPNLEELRHSAMNSYRIGPEVIKTDGGFEVM